MIGYVTIGVSDMEKAKKYYTDLLGDMGAKVLLDLGRIAFIGKDMKSPMMAHRTTPVTGICWRFSQAQKKRLIPIIRKPSNWVQPVAANPVSVFPTSSTVPTYATQTATRWLFTTSADSVLP
jgi:hypothetical protein